MSTLDPDQWRAVSPYLDQALGMPDDDRAAWMAAVREQNPALADQLQTLLDEQRALAHERFLEDGPAALGGQLALAGQTVGRIRCGR